jgi:photosynthetic reaction center H subunit
MSKHELITDDGVRIAPLSSLKDFQVADGYKDIRGWRVSSSDGRDIGKVHDLLVDLDGMRTRYLDVRLLPSIAAADAARDVLVPIGSARIDDRDEMVMVPLTAERAVLLPAYDHEHLLHAHETEIRRHFSLAEAAANTDARDEIVRPISDAL